MNRYSFQLLRYVPNIVSGEFVNIGLLLYDRDEKLIGARFAPDLRRLRCNPSVDHHYLECLRREFEEKLLLGEGLAPYVETLRGDLSNTLQLGGRQVFEGSEAEVEVERLTNAYLTTPRREEVEGEEREPRPGTRQALRRRMDESFRRQALLAHDRLRRQVSVTYGGPRLRFTFDYSYQPNGVVKYVHALGLRNDLSDASKICFAFERMRVGAETPPELTAVVDDAFPEDTLELLESSAVTTCPVSKIDEMAYSIRRDLRI